MDAVGFLSANVVRRLIDAVGARFALSLLELSAGLPHSRNDNVVDALHPCVCLIAVYSLPALGDRSGNCAIQTQATRTSGHDRRGINSL